ncbi:hypothetical protein VW29_17535 [Devosia limi DSM 17137]|uniref:Copper transport protein n=1 Tax=Devosia limi DSM 17137 TaxID=1121477 RepID=A0A0F5LAR8_9HYPH|nr:hypothetical protein VW29_17535 [Devosia limi DSM 17137]
MAALAAMTLLLAIVPVQLAWAHAQLLATDPTENTVLAEAPLAVQLHFNEPVTPLAIGLVGGDGSSLDLLDVASAGATVSVALPAGLVDGTRVLSWRVVSTDGHPIAGALVFSIGSVSGIAPVPVASDDAVGVVLWAGKVLVFVALFFGVGGAIFSAVATLPVASRRTSLVLCLFGVMVASATLGLQGLDGLGLPLGSVFDGRVWAAGLSTSYGNTALVLMVSFVLAAVALCLRAGRGQQVLALLAGGLGALSLALSGHASAAAPEWLTRPAVFLHIGALLFWIGALLPLLLLLRGAAGHADQALARFSRFVPFAIAPLVVSGLVLALIQMGWPGSQWLTPYSAILAAKLVLLVVLFALALWNRQALTAPALAGEAIASRHLRRSILLEIGLVLVILGLVAGWRFTPPPRALAEAPLAVASEPLLVHLMDEQTMAMVFVTPGQAGPVAMDIDLTDLEGMPISPIAVSVTLSAPTLGIEPFKREAVALDAAWRVEDLVIPVPGLWELQLDIRASRFQLVTLREVLEVP